MLGLRCALFTVIGCEWCDELLVAGAATLFGGSGIEGLVALEIRTDGTA